MEYLNQFLLSMNVVILILIVALLTLIVLYLMQVTKTKLLQTKAKHFLNISSKLTDNPMAVFSSKHIVISANHAIRTHIYVKNGDSLKDIKNLPMIKIDEQWLSIIDLIDTYIEKSFENTIFITDAILGLEGNSSPVNIRLRSFNNKTGRKAKYLAMAIFDITNKLEISKIHYQNTTTGLPNHNKALADIGLMTNKMQASNKKFAIIVMSIDNFPELISILGYQQSLYAMSSIANYFQEASHELGLSLYHMTSNNFLIIAPDIQSEKDALSIIEKFKNDTDKLLYVNDENIHFTLSSGVSIYPDNKMKNLLNSAYKALATANKQGTGYTIVSQEHLINKNDKFSIKYSDIQKAIKDEQFVMYYQPIIESETKTIIGAEALMRWIHPTKGLVPPDSFIPIAEKSGLIAELGKFAITSTIVQLGQWNALGFKRIQVSINLTSRELESTNPHEHIASLIEKHGVWSSQVKIEITENIAMSNQDQSYKQFLKLKALGIEISLDDFGTGHSSLSLLKVFPIDTVKIDKSFVLDISMNKDHQVMVKAMIAMTHAMGMKIIAEGVEDSNAVLMLDQFGCDYLQGYHFGKPMPVFEFQELIRTDKQAPHNKHDALETKR